MAETKGSKPSPEQIAKWKATQYDHNMSKPKRRLTIFQWRKYLATKPEVKESSS